MTKIKILFVCLGNICRSPTAETVMKAIVKKHGEIDRFEIDSAGILDYHQGKPSDSRMRKHAAKRGYNITSISRQVKENDFHYFDLIVGMDNQNIYDLKQLTPDKNSALKIVKMTDFLQNKKYNEVPDPYYGGSDGFELVLDLLEDACEGFFQYIIKEN